MRESEQKLFNYYEKYHVWTEERVRNLYNDLKQGEPVIIYTASVDSADFYPKEMQWCTNGVKPSKHFWTGKDNIIPKQQGDFILYFWEELQDSLTIINKDNEYEEFKKWFLKLRNRTTKGGFDFGKKYFRYFLVTDTELDREGKNAFDYMFEVLQEEGIV